MAATNPNLDRVCENIHLAKIAEKIVSLEKYPSLCELYSVDKSEIKQNSRQYAVQKWQVLERWKEKSGDDATYKNLARIFEEAEDQILADFVFELAQDHGKTEPQDYSINETMKRIIRVSGLITVLITVLIFIAVFYHSDTFLHRPVNALYANNIKQRYKKHLPNVAQSFWSVPANMHTFIQLSLTS